MKMKWWRQSAHSNQNSGSPSYIYTYAECGRPKRTSCGRDDDIAKYVRYRRVFLELEWESNEVGCLAGPNAIPTIDHVDDIRVFASRRPRRHDFEPRSS